MSTVRRLPNGKATASVEEYAEAWQKAAKPLEERLGVKLVGFGSGFSFVDDPSVYPRPVNAGTVFLPTWLVVRIVDALEGKR